MRTACTAAGVPLVAYGGMGAEVRSGPPVGVWEPSWQPVGVRVKRKGNCVRRQGVTESAGACAQADVGLTSRNQDRTTDPNKRCGSVGVRLGAWGTALTTCMVLEALLTACTVVGAWERFCTLMGLGALLTGCWVMGAVLRPVGVWEPFVTV